MNDSAGMLHLLAAEPTLLPVAPLDADGETIEARRNENHTCLRCGKPATTALIANFDEHGKRWLDLCYTDFNLVREAN